jgi:NAD(P)-dependent dehydrogenase (short-subunit alcohol dehydrogenase family)
MMKDLKAFRPSVSGGSSGIGWELAKQFVQHGHDLRVAARQIRNAARTELVERASGKLPGQFVGIRKTAHSG